jgi:hypothetical protein
MRQCGFLAAVIEIGHNLVGIADKDLRERRAGPIGGAQGARNLRQLLGRFPERSPIGQRESRQSHAVRRVGPSGSHMHSITNPVTAIQAPVGSLLQARNLERAPHFPKAHPEILRQEILDRGVIGGIPAKFHRLGEGKAKLIGMASGED